MTPQDDYDGPWKEALEVYPPEIIAFCFPDAHRDIDWARGYEVEGQGAPTRRAGQRARRAGRR